MHATYSPTPVRTDLDDFFLDRLRSLVTRQRGALTPAERTTLSIATFSIFLDCLDLGLKAEAQALLDELHGEASATRRMLA